MFLRGEETADPVHIFDRCTIVMGRCRFFKSVSVFGFFVRFFKKSVIGIGFSVFRLFP
jgi:hypothetical protein